MWPVLFVLDAFFAFFGFLNVEHPTGSIGWTVEATLISRYGPYHKRRPDRH